MKQLALALSIASLAACTNTASVLARSSLRPVARAACTVTEIGHDRPDPQSPPRESRWRFDARGALLEHEYNPEYHSRARLLFRRDLSAKLLAIDYQYDRAAESFPCASEGGCETPALHARGRVELEYDGPRVVRRVDARQPGALVIDTFAYDAQGRMTEHRADAGVERFEYEGPRLHRREWSFRHGRGDELYVYAGDRLSEVQRMMCGSVCGARQSRRLTYDAQGLLQRIDHPEGSVDEWRYDEQGRMIARGDGRGERAWYRYDERGRISAWGQGERALREFRYEGACDARAALNESLVGSAQDSSAWDERRWTPTFP